MKRTPSPSLVIDLGSAVSRTLSPQGEVMAITRTEPNSPYTAEELSTLVRTLRRRGIVHRTATVVLPKQTVRVVPVDLPPQGSDAPIAVIAKAQAAEMVGAFPHEIEVSITAPGDERRLASVAVCRHDDAESVIDAFAAAGIGCEALVPPSLASPRERHSRERLTHRA